MRRNYQIFDSIDHEVFGYHRFYRGADGDITTIGSSLDDIIHGGSGDDSLYGNGR